MRIFRISIAIAGSGLVQFPCSQHQPDDPCSTIALAGRTWARTRAFSQKALTDCKSPFPAFLFLKYRRCSPIWFSESGNFAGVTSFTSNRPRAYFACRERLLAPSMCTMFAQRLRRCATPYSSATISHSSARALSRRLASNQRQTREPTSTGKRAACLTSPIPPAFKNDAGQSSVRDKDAHIARALSTLPLTSLTSWHGSSGVHIQEGVPSNILAGVASLSKTRRSNLPFDSVEASTNGWRGY